MGKRSMTDKQLADEIRLLLSRLADRINEAQRRKIGVTFDVRPISPGADVVANCVIERVTREVL